MKRKVPAAVAKGILARVPFQVSFWLCTNENLRSLSDVYEALERASDDVFRYHVNRDKNDFEVWIREVIKDKDLAREIARVKTRETLIRKIRERVDELSSIIKRSGTRKKPARKPSKPRRRAAARARAGVRVVAKVKRKAGKAKLRGKRTQRRSSRRISRSKHKQPRRKFKKSRRYKRSSR